MSTPTEPTAGTPTIATGALRALRAARGDAPDPAGTTEPVHTDTEPTDTEPADTEPTGTEPTRAAEPADDEPADDEPAEDEPPVLDLPGRARSRRAPAQRASTGGGRQISRATLVSALVAAAALVFGVVAGVIWWRADHDGERSAAATRDAVAVDARLAIATVNTSDYRHADDALRNWLSVSTGALNSQFAQSRASAITLLGEAKMVTTATVLDAAVTKLDEAKGTATVIASVNVKKQPSKGSAVTARNRFRASLVRVGDDWKLTDLEQVDVQPL